MKIENLRFNGDYIKKTHSLELDKYSSVDSLIEDMVLYRKYHTNSYLDVDFRHTYYDDVIITLELSEKSLSDFEVQSIINTSCTCKDFPWKTKICPFCSRNAM